LQGVSTHRPTERNWPIRSYGAGDGKAWWRAQTADKPSTTRQALGGLLRAACGCRRDGRQT